MVNERAPGSSKFTKCCESVINHYFQSICSIKTFSTNQEEACFSNLWLDIGGKSDEFLHCISYRKVLFILPMLLLHLSILQISLKLITYFFR